MSETSNTSNLPVHPAFNIAGWLGTALVVASVAIRVLKPEWQQPYGAYAAWAGLALVLVYFAGQWRDVAGFYQGRGARFGTMSVVSIVVFLAILVAVNYLSTRQNKRWDLTSNQVYSLSDQTLKMLQSLDAPVKFTVYDQEANFGRFRDRLTEYAYQSKNVTAEYVDADKNPTRARAADIETYGTVVIEYKDRTERITSTNEQDVTNALIKVVTGAPRKVYFTSGHGEKDTANSERAGYNSAEQALTRDNYGVEKLVLAQAGTVPADATIIIIAGPKTDFLQPEIDAISQYLSRGGKVLVMLDPPDKGSADAPLLTGLLKAWGIAAGNDIVLDASGMGQALGADASVPIAVTYPSHPITANFQLMTAFPMSRSMTPVEGGSDGHTAQPVVETSPQSWAEADLAGMASGSGRVELNPDKGDRPGPIVLAAAVSSPASDAPTPPPAADAAPGAEPPATPESRLVAFGDSEFASNAVLGVQGNRDLFMNAVNWLAQQDNLIAIRPREPEDRRLTLTADQQNGIFLLSIFLIPGLVFASGVYTWWRRR